MALRTIRIENDEVLRKKSREVDKVTDNIRTLLADMAETMYNSDGVGLAAPQVGILKRAIVVDVTGGECLYQLINPRIVASEGEILDAEGCLSVPGKLGEVRRPAKVTVEALNQNEEKVTIEAEGFLARAMCHEIDHLDGVLFIDKVERFYEPEELEARRTARRRIRRPQPRISAESAE